MALKVSTRPIQPTVNVFERTTVGLEENYSSPLLNYVEPVRIDGVDYTRIYTTVDTNLKVGDRVYVVNGNYDTYNIIEINEYRPGTNGYTILEINNCQVTLDIEYTGNLIWNTDDFDNYIKVYPVSNQQELDYEILSNGYYPYKYLYGYRGNNNLLFSVTDQEFRVADSTTDVSNYANWVDITSGFSNNNFPTISGFNLTSNNGKILPMKDFTFGNLEFKKGYIYRYQDGSWVIDDLSRPAYLSKGNFRDGRFSGGTWNDGIFGNIDYSIDWTGATWRNGIFFNANWKQGIMGSKSDAITRQSYYAYLEDGEPKQSTDFENNNGFGYNFIFDSSFEEITINNANATNCSFGTYSATYSVLRRYLEDTNFTFDNTITINNGNYIESIFKNSNIADGTFEFTQIENSISTGRYVDSQLRYSVAAGIFDGLGTIAIEGYEKLISSEEYLYDDPNNPTFIGATNSLVINHKFYLSEDDFIKLESQSWVHFNTLLTNNPNYLNFFDNKFFLGTDISGSIYQSDNYGDTASVTVQLKSKKQNEWVRGVGSQFPVTETPGEYSLPSIDVFVHYLPQAETVTQIFPLGVSANGWNIDTGTSPTHSTSFPDILGSTYSYGFYTDNNTSYGTFQQPNPPAVELNTNESSASYSVAINLGDGATYSIETPNISGVETFKYSWSLAKYNSDPGPSIRLEGLRPGFTSSFTLPFPPFTTITNYNPPQWYFISLHLPFYPAESYNNGTSSTSVQVSPFIQEIINVNDLWSQSLGPDKFRLIFDATAANAINLKIDDIIFEGNLTPEDTSTALLAYNENQSLDINYRMDITNTDAATLQVASIDKTLFHQGTIESSQVNNPDYIINRNARTISGTSGDLGETLDLNFSGGQLEITLKDFSGIFEVDQLELGDVIFLDNIYYDDGSNVLPIKGEYTLATYSTNPLILTLDDLGSQSIAGSYSGGGDFFSGFVITGTNSYDITQPQESFNSIYLEKFNETTISSGFHKRNYYQNSIFENDDLEIQTDFNNTNIKQLKLSEMVWSNTNNLTLNNGFMIRNSMRGLTVSNGMIYHSLLKDNVLNNGVVKQSKWISGTVNNGTFLVANKNEISNPTNTSKNFTTESLAAEWNTGNFYNGTFTDAIWDFGNFYGGNFYNGAFAAGNFYGGNFGDVRYSNSSSQFADPTWTHNSVNNLGHPEPVWWDGKFINGEFGIRGPVAGLPNPTVGTISWKSGNFQDGIILSYTSSTPVIWEDGSFNNGEVLGYVHWKDGIFNNGKFNSAWGTGYGTNSSNYAWVDGIFNSGRFGDSSGVVTTQFNGTASYRNPSWYTGRFNDGFFFGKIWNDGIFTGGRFIGNSFSSYRIPIRETIPESFETTSGVETFEGDLGTWNVTNTGNGIPQSFNYLYLESGPAYSSSTYPYSLQLTAVTSSSFVGFNTGGSITNDGILSSPILNEPVATIEFSYEQTINMVSGIQVFQIEIEIEATNDGVNFINLGNFLDADVVNGGGFYTNRGFGDISFPELGPGYQYIFNISFNFNSSGVWSSAQLKLDDLIFRTRKSKVSSIPDQFVMDYSQENTVINPRDPVPFFGMWRNGKVISDNTVEVSKSSFLEISQLESIRRFRGDSTPDIVFENALWVNGEFIAFGDMINSVWLNGEFKNGRFIDSSFNPFVPRWDFTTDYSGISGAIGNYSYETTDSCKWISGYLDNSDFHISEWNGGFFNSGNMYGGYFKKGVANYINAYNCIWDGGRWRNGNWYGSNYDLNDLFTETGTPNWLNLLFTKNTDSIIKNSQRLGNTFSSPVNVFTWNLVDDSDPNNYSSGITYDLIDGGVNTYGTGTMSNNEVEAFLGTMSSFNDKNVDSISLENQKYLGLNFQNELETLNLNPNTASSYLLSFTSNIPVSGETNDGFTTPYWGNGVFISGIWENGVWNNGPRENEIFNTENVLVNLEEVNNYFGIGIDKWQVEITGNESLTNFNVGDTIAIGNIVGLTVNGTRKFFTDSYQIIDINNLTNTLSIIIKTSFPIRSIEKDSPNHQIRVTKNVWEGGKFHNGTFEGVWNSGTFEGYPRVTRMSNTQWITGYFNGGYFNSDTTFVSAVQYNTSLIQDAYIDLISNQSATVFLSHLDLNFSDDDTQVTLWEDGALLPNPYDVSIDVLSSNTKSWFDDGNARRSIVFSWGEKSVDYDELIQDDLDNILGPNFVGTASYLSNQGWSFLRKPLSIPIIYVPLPDDQEKFVAYDNSGSFSPQIPLNLMNIDLTADPATFSAGDDYVIRHDNYTNIIRDRYWKVSFDIVNTSIGGSNPDSYIAPYPPPTPTAKYYTPGTVEVYHFNFNPQSEIIVAGLTASGQIDNIKFTEVDKIPFPKYWNTSANIDYDLKVPKRSISGAMEISEADAQFIDNNSNQPKL